MVFKMTFYNIDFSNVTYFCIVITITIKDAPIFRFLGHLKINWLGTIYHFPNLRRLEHVKNSVDLENGVLFQANLSKGSPKPHKVETS